MTRSRVTRADCGCFLVGPDENGQLDLVSGPSRSCPLHDGEPFDAFQDFRAERPELTRDEAAREFGWPTKEEAA